MAEIFFWQNINLIIWEKRKIQKQDVITIVSWLINVIWVSISVYLQQMYMQQKLNYFSLDFVFLTDTKKRRTHERRGSLFSFFSFSSWITKFSLHLHQSVIFSLSLSPTLSRFTSDCLYSMLTLFEFRICIQIIKK